MEQFKIENFERENLGRSFPQFQPLAPSKCEDIRLRICESFGLPSELIGSTLTRRVAQLQSQLSGVNAEHEEFSLGDALREFGVFAQDDVLINWYQFDDIDQISLETLSTYFDDIWYPASDDIDIFDFSFSWIVSVNHDGEVFSARTESG